MKSLKKIIALIMIALLVLSLSGCSTFEGIIHPDNTNEIEITKNPFINDLNSVNNIEYNSSYVHRQLDYGYNALRTDEQRNFYKKLLEVSYLVGGRPNDDGYYFCEKIYLDKDFPSTEMRFVITAFKEDHPEIFWLSSAFSFIIYDSEIEFSPLSTFSGNTLKKIIPKFNEKLNEIVSSVPAQLSEYERELFLYDYLIDNCTYDYVAFQTLEDDCAFNTFGSIVNGLATCQGYAEAFSLLLSMVGVESVNVTGTADNVNHLWTAVKLGGNWYYTDITFDDNDDEEQYGLQRYRHFNITTEQLEENHIIGKMFDDLSDEQIDGTDTTAPMNFNLFIPVCDSREFNYYYKELPHVTDLGEENRHELSVALLDYVDSYQDYFYMYVDYDQSFDNVYDALFSDEQYYFDFVEYVNDYSAFTKILDNTNVVQNAERRLIGAEILYE